ncbi:ABC transporter ATP-binding protein [Sediminibacillus halophilus]|uniref:Putative ABC transport system ATP-binding protein n=1 Tax=Sediminibacillus halophilus TaxID=482461 RepID=A0A1G9NSC9_9BACI|nr:ABC transporter ATP-binding protein [Sediminibacillus halophilus]SDL89516.1 putative ABC transport system ATP-binding protein [Sediminibacillus halophilus]
MLIIKNVSKSFREATQTSTILNNIHWQINRAEWCSVVGPSGTGKTTLLHCISGLLQPDEGHVHFKGTDIYSLSEKKRSNWRRKHLGFIFQDFKLLPHYSVLDNVALPLIFDEAKGPLYDRAKEKLKLVGLEETFFSRLPGGLSGGEKQRVAIARSLIAEPDILICDEPTGNLDSDNRDKIADLFSELKKSGQAILMVTHDPEIARKGDKTYQLSGGSLFVKEVTA